MKRTYTKEEIEQRARIEFGWDKRAEWDALSGKERASWMRSATYRLRQEEIEHTVDSAVANEATTKGWDAAHQGAWDNAQIYADMAGIEVEQFRKYMLKKMRGQFTPKEK